MSRCRNSSIDLHEKTPIPDLVPMVAFLVPEMDIGVIQYFLRLAIIKFARESQILFRDIEFTVHPNTCDYYIELPDYYNLYRLRDVRLNDCPLRITNNCKKRAGQFQYRQGKISLCAPTCDTDELTARFVVLPSIASCAIDSDIVDLYPDAIIEAFKSLVYSGNDKRWKNLTEARQALAEFKRQVVRAQSDSIAGHISYTPHRLTS